MFGSDFTWGQFVLVFSFQQFDRMPHFGEWNEARMDKKEGTATQKQNQNRWTPDPIAKGDDEFFEGTLFLGFPGDFG